MCCLDDGIGTTGHVVMIVLVGLSALLLLRFLWFLLPSLIKLPRMIVREIKAIQSAGSAAAGISPEDALSIFTSISNAGNALAKGCIGIYPTGPIQAQGIELTLPDGIPDFPWSGQMVSARLAGFDRDLPVAFDLKPNLKPSTSLMPATAFFWPPYFIRSGKAGQHVFSVAHYLKLLPDLAQRLEGLCEGRSAEVLETIFSRHGIELGDRGVRIGLAPVWIQSGRFHKCERCGRPMRLIVQFPGSLIDKKLAEGNFYLFGCSSHPDFVRPDQDWY